MGQGGGISRVSGWGLPYPLCVSTPLPLCWKLLNEPQLECGHTCPLWVVMDKTNWTEGSSVSFSPQVMHCTSGFFLVGSLDGRGVSELLWHLPAAIRTDFPTATDGRDEWGLLIQG